MKMRVLLAASIFLAAVLIAATSHAAPSCCDPKNAATPGAALALGQPTRGPISAARPQQRLVTPQAAPAMVKSNGWNFPGPAPQGQYAAPKPVAFPNAPAAPSCCAVPNGAGPARTIGPVPQAQFGGCGCSAGAGPRTSYPASQPMGRAAQLVSAPPNTGQQVYPVGQASCCPAPRAACPGGWSNSQPQGFGGLW